MPQVSAQPFSNRAEAGRLLAARFSALAWREDVIVATAVSDEDAKERFGDFDAKKPYLRVTKQPS